MGIGSQLDALGWRGCASSSSRLDFGIRDFQLGWNLGERLVVDGIAGPKTLVALAISNKNLRAGNGTASAHFSFTEFACKCSGNCRRIHILASHIRRLEEYRNDTKHPVVIVSGYRCPGHNAACGGAHNSQHLYGTATDIVGRWQSPAVRSLTLFAGIGYQQSTGLVVHVDSRDLGINNTTKSKPAWPAMWKYAA